MGIMRAVLITAAIILFSLFLVTGVSVRWAKFKNNPTETQTEKHFEIDRKKVKNSEPNKIYYGTVIIKTKYESGNWPVVRKIVEHDTLTVEQGGYFGIPK